ncbi:hypothetical protein [Legionella maioricensis]|uniref:Uncharacterized protein n=1 Tax=Legionella maioricensis TaxID=2896528 RepID=A0A9X2D3C6_9GAMM|nr:hypothetical protein [Legionella maioricensis]MCL9685779.1 hypothetical protein [Legionella maioricensis]MCL9689181.1 hypothetical protein [Legionella maioricensis]
MAKNKRKQQASYRPIPRKNRFWIYSESCYTEEDLAFREWILKVRANSGIDADYLTNPSSWFAEDQQALINVYENAWFYSNAFKTRHLLSQDDFHVQPVDSQRLQWPALYNLMQNVGDYLLIRNRNLPSEHLNQPMNYVFLDINFILKGLSQNPNVGQVKEQLEVLNRYVRTIEKNISPIVGSDRLFMANFRRIIDDNITPQLTHFIETQLLKERLGDLSKTIQKASTERNRILHFALNVNPVNPHPYDFSTAALADSTAYPTQIAKECGSNSNELSTELMSTLRLTVEQLRDCPNFSLISMDEEILSHYADAVSDLNELERFQNVISQVTDLLNQAGEVYTVHQFKEQMLTLLNQIEGFIDDSSQHIEAIIHANTQAYHQAIEVEQNLSLWQKWLTSEQEKLKTFISNQDTLAQFPSSTADLSKTNKVLKGQVNEVIRHLNQPKTKQITFDGLAGQAQQLNKLMLSMHQWIKIQYEIKGLDAPKPPEPLKLLPPSKPLFKPITTTQLPIAFSTSPPVSFFTPKSAPSAICPANQSECTVQFKEPESTINGLVYLGLIALLPIGVIALYLLMKRCNKTQKSVAMGTQEEFEPIKVQFDDLITIIKGVEFEENSVESHRCEDFISDYEKLCAKAQAGNYDVEALKEMYDDLDCFYKESCKILIISQNP